MKHCFSCFVIKMTRFVIFVAFLFVWNFLNILADPPYTYRNVGDFKFQTDNVSYRLPNTTKPEAYEIVLFTNIADGGFVFSGTVKIAVRVLQQTNNITLHQRQLTIGSVKLEHEDGHPIRTALPDYDPVTEFLTINTIDDPIWPGSKVFLTIEYKGLLRQDYAGFYRSSYRNSDGKQVWLATTQFEPNDARHAFPCYDEPALKATFDIRIFHSPNYYAVSNMPEIDRYETISGLVSTRFKKTPPTSSYLIAFIVSDFAYKERWSQVGFRHRVLAKPNEIESATFAVNESEKILNGIGDYLQVNYTLPKMDSAAIPNFGPGAMENWGLVTYREEYLLYDETIHSNRRKTDVVTTIAHEFGHQWFGDLVSPKWWNFLWLNEGFATLFQNIGTDLVHPDWNIFHTFVVNQLHGVLRSDATNRTRPMTFYIENPAGIHGLFDDIAYAKSGSVLRMFMHAFNESSFKKGLKYYLNERSFDAAVDVDLFDGLERAVKEDNTLAPSLNVREIFSSWSDQKGYPLLRVTRNYEKNNIKISQERYFNKYPYPESSSTTWWIPYNFDTANNVHVNNTSPDGWLAKGTRSALIEPAGNKPWSINDWVLFNKQQTGFYRILYDRRNYKMILHELNTGNLQKFHALCRAQLLDDVDDFVQSGQLPFDIYFEFLRYLKREIDYAPWVAASKSLFRTKRSLVEGSNAYEKYKRIVADVVKPFYESNTFNATADESVLKSSARGIAIKLACEFGVESCLEDAKKLLEESYKCDNVTFSTRNTRGSIYDFGIRFANSNLTEMVWNRLSLTTNSEERQEILNCFGNIANETNLREFLYRAIDSDNNLTRTDRGLLFIGIATRSQYGLSQAIDLLSNEVNATRTHLDLNNILQTLTNSINTNHIKNRFMSIITSMTRENVLTEDQFNVIEEKLNEAILILTKNRKPLEDEVLALPDNFGNSASFNQMSGGLATLVMIFINVMIIHK